jgi:hypothetical protein
MVSVETAAEGVLPFLTAFDREGSSLFLVSRCEDPLSLFADAFAGGIDCSSKEICTM